MRPAVHPKMKIPSLHKNCNIVLKIATQRHISPGERIRLENLSPITSRYIAMQCNALIHSDMFREAALSCVSYVELCSTCLEHSCGTGVSEKKKLGCNISLKK